MKPDPARARDAPPAALGLTPASEALGDRTESDVPLNNLLWTTLDHWRLVLATTALVFLAAVAFVWLAAPTYHSDALIQVEDKGKTLPGLDDVQSMFSDKSVADAEIAIIRSRTLMGEVVDQLNLTVAAGPVRFPMVGGFLARRHRQQWIAPPVLGMSLYGWGGERIVVTRLEVPDSLVNQQLRLVTRESDGYDLFDASGVLLASGRVGVAATGQHADGPVSLFVQELRSRPGTRFWVIKWRRADFVGVLQSTVTAVENPKKTGIITISLDGKNPKDIAAVLDSVAQNYVRQNVERRSAEAAKTLEFLDAQLPILKKNLEAAEAALNDYRAERGTIDLTRETQALMDRAAEIEKASFELNLTRSELSQRFTDTHPALQSLQDKLQKLKAERASLELKLRGLPEQEITTIRMMRDAKVASELYVMLLNKSEELRVVKSGMIGNVRILDPALVPSTPASPRKGLVLGLSVLGGLVGGIALAFAKKAIDQGLKDPDEIESKTGLAIYASVPHSHREDALARERTRTDSHRVLAVDDPTDLAVESLRSLRTSLQFTLVEAPNNIVTIGGPSPGVGKTFLSVNLSHVLAQAGQRVLLVDGDLRKGKLHRFFGGQRAPGLSEIVSGQARLEDVARSVERPGLSVITTGKLPPNPSELLGSKGFKAFVERASAAYDLVLIDAPPLLAVTDAAIIAAHAGVNLLVLRAGRHPPREIVAALKSLAHAGARANGAVVNDVRSSVGTRYGPYGRKYHYHYEYHSDDEDT
jgi:tyrosine-protein kinase Etk/Wzc